MKIKVQNFEKKPQKSTYKLRFNKNKQIGYTKNLIIESPLESA